jgi:membrane fusion protein (multidrug efflux system)
MSVRLVVGLGIVVLAAAAIAVPKLISRERSAPAAATTSETRLRVEVIELAPRRLTERFATTGTLRSNEYVNLVSEIAGKVESIAFDEGRAVRAGQLLVKIEDDELQARRDSVRHRLELAESREARQRELREQGIISQQELDLITSEVNVLRAELRLVEAQLEKTEIRAPFSGVVGLRFVSAGSLLSAQTRIATLQDLDPVKIDFTLPERYARTIAPGRRIEFRVEGVDRPFEAEVYAVEPRIDPETRSLLIRASSPNPGGELLPGAFADVELVVAEVPDALVVPSVAVIPELGGKKVFVVEGGEAVPRPVETGIRTETDVQITRGLEPGDRVIVSAIQRLRPGLAVEALQSPTAGAESR